MIAEPINVCLSVDDGFVDRLVRKARGERQLNGAVTPNPSHRADVPKAASRPLVHRSCRTLGAIAATFMLWRQSVVSSQAPTSQHVPF